MCNSFNVSSYSKYTEKKYLVTFSLDFSMILVKKLKFFNILCLSKIDQEKAFPDVLYRK